MKSIALNIKAVILDLRVIYTSLFSYNVSSSLVIRDIGFISWSGSLLLWQEVKIKLLARTEVILKKKKRLKDGSSHWAAVEQHDLPLMWQFTILPAGGQLQGCC